MAQTIFITLTSAGTDTGPFNLYSNLDGFTVAFETNVPKLVLEAGYTSYSVPDGATVIRIRSNNVLCGNSIDVPIESTTTTTTTTPDHNLFFDWEGADTLVVTDIDVNSVTPALVDGTGVPFGSGMHEYLTSETGVNETLNITITGGAGESITVADSDGNVFCQNISGDGVYTFPGLVISSVPVIITGVDGTCV